ncbi:MAG: DUF4267 domain-containing protein [Alphaproteobacteria bacterium]|nr:DUF4267 domain-containing protein [Alphaproteobacteria bacterium]
MRTILPAIVTLGSVLMGLGLLGLCAHATLDPAGASLVYGLPSDGEALPWIRAAGARDGVLGLVLLGTLWRHRAALPVVVGASLIVPLADVAVCLSGGAAWAAAAPHLLGTVAIGVLLGLVMAERRLAALA